MIPYSLGFYDKKLFKEKLGALTYIQVCMIIWLRTDEEKFEESPFKDQTHALKITSEDFESDGRSRLWRKLASGHPNSEASEAKKWTLKWSASEEWSLKKFNL